MTVRPTPAQVTVLGAYLEDGSAKAAAHRLECSEAFVKNTLNRARRRTGLTTAQLIYLGCAEGWLPAPGLRRGEQNVSLPESG